MRHKSHTPQVATYFPSLHQGGYVDANVHMFTEDVRLAVMPIGGKSSEVSEFAVEIQGSSQQIDYATALLKSLAQYEGYGLEELLSNAVEGVASRLAWRGLAVYEIIRDEENDNAYLLHNFTSERLFHVFGRYVQVIPKADRDLWGKTYVVIPEKDIWEVSIPKPLGGHRGYRTILRGLARFQHLGPPFWRNDLSKLNQPAHFDFQRYVREADIFYSKITAQWGWDRRDYSQRNWTEFYQFYRSLRFKWVQASMREHIVSELNGLLRRLSIEAEIIVQGLPTTSKIADVRRQMLKGHVSFGDAYDACSV